MHRFWRVPTAIALVLLVSGCQTLVVRKPPSVKDRQSVHLEPLPQYGGWWIDTSTCLVHTTAADFTLTTDGHIEKNGTMHLRAQFTGPLAAPPQAELSHLPVPVPVEGGRGIYSIILAYDSATAAHMLADDTHLIVSYQPTRETRVLESSFPTRGLVQAMADMHRNCH